MLAELKTGTSLDSIVSWPKLKFVFDPCFGVVNERKEESILLCGVELAYQKQELAFFLSWRCLACSVCQLLVASVDFLRCITICPRRLLASHPDLKDLQLKVQLSHNHCHLAVDAGDSAVCGYTPQDRSHDSRYLVFSLHPNATP